MQKCALYFFFIFLFIACNNKDKEVEVSGNSSKYSDNELIQAIFTLGDTAAYNTLCMVYLDYGSEKFLPFALIMANKYDYPKAYFDVFSCLHDIYGDTTKDLWILDNLDSTTQSFALNYLKKSSSKGYFQAKDILGHYYLFGKYVEKDTVLGKQLINESESLLFGK